MRMCYFSLFFIVISCGKENAISYKNDNRINSLNTGLIGVNYNGIYLNKINDLQLYDSNGNFKKIIATYSRSYYQTIDVKDSFIALIGNSSHTLFHCDSIVKNLLPKSESIFNFHKNKNNLFVLVSNENSIYFNSENKYINNYLIRGYKVQIENGKLNNYNEFNTFSNLNFPNKAKTFSVLNDSMFVFLSNSFELMNLNQPSKNSRTLLNFTNSNESNFTSFANKNQFLLGIDNEIYSYTLIANSFLLNKVIK